MIGPITPGMKPTGKRSAGNPHAAFDVAGAGNVTMVAGLRSTTKVMELPPAPTVRAPALDPTDEREQETELCQTGLRRARESKPISHREAKATAAVLDSTPHLTHLGSMTVSPCLRQLTSGLPAIRGQSAPGIDGNSVGEICEERSRVTP
jgi:hypothetical protein